MSGSDQHTTYVIDPAISPPESDSNYAQSFKDLEDAIARCSQSDNVALLLSTCRNAYLTLNALFVEMTLAVGGGETVLPINRAADFLRNGNFPNALRDIGKAREVLKQFRTKEEVWERREELWNAFETALSQVAQPGQNQLRRVIRKSKSSNTHTGQTWNSALYDIDRSDRLELAESFSIVRQAHELIEAATHAVFLLCTFDAQLGAQEKPCQQTLFHEKGREEKGRTWEEVYEAIIRLVDLLQFIISPASADDGVVTVSRDGLGTDLFVLSRDNNISRAGLRGISQGVSNAVTTATKKAYSLLCQFQPNIAKPPMPDPFVIDLTPERIAPGVALKKLCLVPIGFGTPSDPPNDVTLAIAHFPVPATKYSDHHRFTDDGVRNQLTEIALRLIRLAATHKSALIIFPEYAIPRSALEKLADEARNENIVLVAGLEGKWIEHQLVNEAAVVLPHLKAIQYQRKQKPSVYEVKESAFLSDGEMKLFNSLQVGSFGVVICSDFLEMDVMSTICDPREHPDFILVPAYNPYTLLFERAAASDAVRFYTNVVVANTFCVNGECSSKGSLAVSPSRDMKIGCGNRVNLPGDDTYGIGLVHMSRSAISGRQRGKPDEGFFAPPHTMRLGT